MENNKKYTLSDERRKQVSEMSKRPRTPEWKKNISNSLEGKSKTEKHKESLKKAWGKLTTEERAERTEKGRKTKLEKYRQQDDNDKEIDHS